MKKMSRKLVMMIILTTMVFAVAISIGVYAIISSTSTRGNIEITTDEIKATTSYSSSTNSFSWTFEEAGDNKTVVIATTNQSGAVLHSIYNVTSTGDTNLLNAILVYFNGEYIGTLSELNTVPLDIEDKYSFIPLTNSVSDSLKFELHQAATSSIFDGKSVTVTITSIIQNTDYLDYIFVTNEDEFKRAVDDVNSGLFSVTPTIILCNALNLENSYTLKNPTKIYLNGKTLNGSLTINDDNTTSPDAVLEVLGDGTFNANVTVGDYYDEAAALALFVEHAKEALGESVAAGSTTDIIGYYSFYEFGVTVGSNCTFTSPNVIIPNTTSEYYSKVASIVIDTETIEFKVVGSMSALIDATLAHLPSTGENVTADLFLPTYIKDENSAITWKSSNDDVMSSEGKIASTRLDNEEITLYAEIKINDTVVTRTFNFTVSAHNNEINFYKLVQEISPIVIANVYTSEADADDALYYLPIVSANSSGTFNSYDYRTSYESPVNTKLFNWLAYKDIGLKNLTYSMTEEQIAAYEYITQSGNNLYLNKNTLNNFARINITGDFGNDETYTTYINISISVGSDTQLLEKAFAQISEELADISVLGNILSTRISDGMANEKGDFSLNSVYLNDNDYTIEFSGVSNIIDSITYNSTTKKYDFTINPEYFNEYETTVAFKATVYYKKGTIAETSKSRTFYVVVPAALHVDDFGTISLYNSLKYQTYLSLPSNERSGTSGYTKTTTKLVDSNLNYVLLRDIVGDSSYLIEYGANDLYLEKISYTSNSQYAEGVKNVELLINSDNSSDATDTYAYDFAKLIEWATGNTRVTAGSVVSNTAAISGLTSIKANGADYLNDDEVAVLKACYKYYTGASDNDWTTMFNEIFNVAPGYIYTNPELLNAVIKALGSNNISFTSENFQNLFGKHMEILQRYAVATTNVNANNVAPCQEQYNTKFAWTHTSTNDTVIGISSNTINLNGTGYTANYSIQVADGTWWQRFSYSNKAGGDGAVSGLYARPAFAADKTSYITSAELQVMMMFWLNACGNNLNTVITDTNQQIISIILTNDAGKYYSNYGISDFSYVGPSIINAFYACLEVPTYFTTDGISKLVKYFYNNYNYNSSKYELPTYDGEVTTTFASALNNRGIPYVTNVDCLKAALSYFTSVEELSIIGTSSLSAFLSENGIFTVYTRASLDNLNIYKLIMNYCASDYVNFDLSNISNYDSLTYLDLSNNKGIGSVNELVNVNRSNYTYVDISNIGISFDYQEFAIDNIATPICTIWYTNSSGNRESSNDDTYASVVSDLSDFNKFITKYMYMSNVVYDENGNAITINWRIDEGNDIYGTPILNGGTYPEISSIEEMNQLVSPYYYALEDFTYTYNGSNYSFLNKYVYEISFENGSLVKTTVGGPYETISDLSNLSAYETEIEKPEDLNDYIPEETFTIATYDTGNLDGEYYDYKSFYSGYVSNLTINNVYKITISRDGSGSNSGYLWYGNFANGDNNINNNVQSNSCRNFLGGGNGLTKSSANEANSFFFLTYEQFNNITSGSLKVVDAATYTKVYGATISSTSIYYLCFIYNEELYAVGDNGDRTGSNDYVIGATTDIDNAATIKFLGNYSSNSNMLQLGFSRDTGRRFRRNVAGRLVIHSQAASTSFEKTTNISYISEFTVNYKNGKVLHETGYYACGYNIVHYRGTVTVTETQYINEFYKLSDNIFEFYYDGNNASVTNILGDSIPIKSGTIIQIAPYYSYSASRNRVYTLYGNIYVWEFFYAKTKSDYNTTNEVTIDGNLISSIEIKHMNTTSTYTEANMLALLPNNSATKTQISGFDVDWDTVPLESIWEFGWYVEPYISYVTKVSNSSHKLLDDQVDYYEVLSNDGEYIVRYTGTTNQEGIYVESTSSTTTSYTHNYGYNLIINSNNELSWNEYATSLTNTTTNNMKTILDTANQHFGDNQYGAYYGMYYGYAGESMYDESLGMYLKQYYVYRIMPNANNSAFEWQEVQKYYAERTPSQMLLELGTGVSGVGDIYYAEGSTAFNTFFPQGWYKVVIDEKTNIVNLVKFNDMAITISEKYTGLENQKIHGISSDYLGYSGTFTTQISALYRVKNADGSYKDYIKTYKLRFVGSLTS